MRLTKVTLGLVLGFGLLAAAAPRANAAEGSSTTVVSFNRPVAIPGKVLSSGTYLFAATGPVLQIWNADRSSIYATLFTNAAERTDLNTRNFELEERTDDSPVKVQEIKTWFREGQSIGQELIYPQADSKDGRSAN